MHVYISEEDIVIQYDILRKSIILITLIFVDSKAVLTN